MDRDANAKVVTRKQPPEAPARSAAAAPEEREQEPKDPTPMNRGGGLMPRAVPEDDVEVVDEAVDESFPASDPPAFTPSQGS